MWGRSAFFPWLRLEPPTTIAVGDFELIPYERETYAGPNTTAVNAVTAPYREVTDEPIAEATLVRCAGRDLIADLDDDQIASAFTFAEMVALAGLARRRFFSHGGYSNRDTYRLVVQGFDVPGQGSLSRAPRRDGTRGVFQPSRRAPVCFARSTSTAIALSSISNFCGH